MVLAGGAGTRYSGSTHKLLAPIRGERVLDLAVRSAVASGIGPVAVVWGALDLSAHLPPGVASVPNPRWADGQATSLARAVEWADSIGCDAVVIGLADQPDVGVAAWREVATDPRSGVIAADFGGGPRPPVRLDRAVWPLLPKDGDEGARALFQQRPELLHTVPVPGDPADNDTVEDLARWS